MTKSTDDQIAEETALIKELEAMEPKPEYRTTAYWVYTTKIRDAYWRRRNLMTVKKQGCTLTEAARDNFY